MMNNNSNQFIEEEITFGELANRLGITDLDSPEVYDLEKDSGYEYQIESFDMETGQKVWKDLTHFVVKSNSPVHYKLGELKGTPQHKVLYNGEFVGLASHPEAKLIESPIQVVDCQVADTHNYVAEGQVNHNTTTPGGKTVPFFSSVRLRLYGGKPVVKNIGGKDVSIGIEVRCKVIKNKLTFPYRETNFEIHFGKGVVDDPYVFDYLRTWCDSNSAIIDGKSVKLSGTNAWKTFTLSDITTGEVIKEVKFYKDNFGEMILRNPEYQNYIIGLMDMAYIMKPGDLGHATYAGLDTSSSEEMRTVNEEN